MNFISHLATAQNRFCFLSGFVGRRFAEVLGAALIRICANHRLEVAAGFLMEFRGFFE